MVGFDREETANAGRLRELGVEVHRGREEETLLQGIDLVVKSPGCRVRRCSSPARGRATSPCGARSSWGHACSRIPSSASPAPTARRRRASSWGRSFARTTGRSRWQATSADRSRPWWGRSSRRPGSSASSRPFQLEDVETLRPHIGVLLNLEPDHLDRHGSFEPYAAAKLRMFERQTGEDTAVVPAGLRCGSGCRPASRVPCRRRASGRAAHPWAPQSRERCRSDCRRASRRHLRRAIAQALRTFAGVPHRIELVRERRGGALRQRLEGYERRRRLRAIASFPGSRLHVILGGRGKPSPTIRSRPPSGPATARTSSGRRRTRSPPRSTASASPTSTRVTSPRRWPRPSANAEPGDVVLLSPACAELDQFEDFEARGDAFRRLVEAMA